MANQAYTKHTGQSSNFGDLVTKLRKDKGWSRSDLAREIWGEQEREDGTRAAKGRYNVSTWENGKHLPRPDVIVRIAEALDAPVEELHAARYKDERERAAPQNMAPPEITTSSVAGRPDLVRMTARAVVPLDKFPEIVQAISSAAALSTKEADNGDGS